MWNKGSAWLADAGVYSLKIEGRMKQIPYAAGVVSYYRKYIDLFLSGQETQISEEDYRAVLALGNRCGFTDGYYHRHNGSDMVTFTKPNYEKTNEALQQQILRTYENGAAKSLSGESWFCIRDRLHITG